MIILSKIECSTDPELDDNYTLYDTGTIVHEYDKSRYPGQQNFTEKLHPDDLDEELKELLLEKADEQYKNVVAELFRLGDFQNLNGLFKDQVSLVYYQKYTDLLAQKLKISTLKMIRNSNIILLMSLSPGIVLSNFKFSSDKAAHIIILDRNLIQYCDFSLLETSALLLHEFGHIFNNPEDQSQKEFYADYFAKNNGFGMYLSAALKKLQKKDLAFIPSQFKTEIEHRITALDNSEQEPLVGESKI